MPQTSLNMRITGNPGTGKTSLARLIFRYLHAYGILPKNTFVEKNGLEMKGKYVGHTAPTVKEAIAEAMGGCLFLDEAYALADNGGDSFSGEAVRTLLTEVENNRTRLMVVLAGYADKMQDLMRADPGLPRRFPNEIHLQDYTAAELAEIAHKVAVKQYNLRFESGLEVELAYHILDKHQHEISSQNGGLALNLVERALSVFASRVVAEVSADAATANTMVAADFGILDKVPLDANVLDDEAEDVSATAIDAESEEFRRQLSSIHSPEATTKLRRTVSTPADGLRARRSSYKVRAAAANFGKRLAVTSTSDWLQISRAGEQSVLFPGPTARSAGSPPGSPSSVLPSIQEITRVPGPATQAQSQSLGDLQAQNHELQVRQCQ